MGKARYLLALIVLLVGSAVLRAQQRPTPATREVTLVHTRQGKFSIPFQLDNQRSTLQPVEVRLFVSVDRGANWKPHGKVQPSQKEFAFDASSDGEYWFSIRTIDSQGRSYP